MATERNVTSLGVQTTPSALNNKAFVLFDKSTGAPIAVDAQTFLRNEYVDLSMYDIFGASLLGRETANCYIIRKSGWYKFPLVYGNAIKHGVANTLSYTNQGGANQGNFVNHLGNQITDPYIERNAGVNIHHAEISWADENNLITNLSIVEGGDCKYLQFEVPSVPNLNGNAQLNICDSAGVVIWSWHIWVTGDDLTPVEITNHAGTKYKIMPLNLGWKWDTGRSRGRNPHYQWGRKDPFPCPAAYNTNGNTALYNAAKGFANEEVTATHSIADSIKRPHSFFKGLEADSYRWEHSDKFNLWDANRNNTGADGNIIAKTIYDPSPVGFTVPNGNAFTGFSTTGSNTETVGQFNIIGAWDAGFTFKRNASDTNGIFFPASGYRNGASAAVSSVVGLGSYWCAAPYSSVSGRYLGFYSGGLWPLYADGRSSGFSVRSLQES